MHHAVSLARRCAADENHEAAGGALTGLVAINAACNVAKGEVLRQQPVRRTSRIARHSDHREPEVHAPRRERGIGRRDEGQMEQSM